MTSSHEEKLGPEILDVNHYDSMVWVRFTDGRSVKLSAKEVLSIANHSGEGEAPQANSGQGVTTAFDAG